MSTPITRGSEHPEFAETFVGREMELHAISSAFQRGARIVCVYGPGGSGKSALVRMYSTRATTHPSGVITVFGRDESLADRIFAAVADLPGLGRRLLVVDGVDEARDFSRAFIGEFASVIRSLQKRARDIDFLVTSRIPLIVDPDRQVTIELEGLRGDEAALLFERLGPDIDLSIAQSLIHRLSGHPLALKIVAAALRNRTHTVSELVALLNDFAHPSIVGLDGEPLRSDSKAGSQIIVDVTAVNEELLQLLQREPQMLWSIPSRRFEEVVAELLSRHGYDVTLTPASKDGGVDIYAAKKDTLGQFLFLVECKRYVPPNKVGVEIVRSLHGVVSSTKATAGVLVTSSYFTSGAQEFQRQNAHQIQLHDYMILRSWLDGLSRR